MLLAAAGTSFGSTAGTAARGGGNPLAGWRLYVNPDYPAGGQAQAWRAEGRSADAAAMAALARRSTGVWLPTDDGAEARARTVTQLAARAHQVPVLVVYFVPNRGCGGFSAGGARSAAGYRAYVRAVAKGIGRRRAVVVVEPDALAQTFSSCVTPAHRSGRFHLLRFAVRTLAATPRARVYLDAGNAGWISPVSRLVRPLRASGIAKADGFSLNVSNFYGTNRTVRYGRALSSRLRGKHFVIDTGRNGNGPAPTAPAIPEWCNPPGRALGHDPTTHTRRARVDAYLWVKEPGMSDGACRPGAPVAGVWWPEYALDLVRNSGGG